MCDRVLEEGELSPLTRASDVECGMVGEMCCEMVVWYRMVGYCVGLRVGMSVMVVGW